MRERSGRLADLVCSRWEEFKGIEGIVARRVDFVNEPHAVHIM